MQNNNKKNYDIINVKKLKKIVQIRKKHTGVLIFIYLIIYIIISLNCNISYGLTENDIIGDVDIKINVRRTERIIIFIR